MAQKKNPISRKDALKKLGGLALSVPFGMNAIPALGSIGEHTSKTEVSFPGIIPHRKSDKPNILWITAEGVPTSVLSCYGSKIMRTPNIDRIAQGGMMFNNSFCTNALCAPSRATLLTGKYNHLCGMEVNSGHSEAGDPLTLFNPSQETFPKILKKNGYKTGLVGKWHLTSEVGKSANPGEAGFDYFVFKRGAGGPYYKEEGYLQNPSLGSHEIQKREYPGYMTDNFTDLAIEGIKQLKEPFCMCLQYFNDHRPFQPPHKYEHIYDDVHFPEPGTFWDDYEFRSAAAREAHMRLSDDLKDFDSPKDYTKRQLQQWNYQRLMRRFLGTLKAQDDNIGRLLNYLDKAGLTENTIVVLTSDHGFFLGDHGWFDKRMMYEQALRVPWIIRYPGVTKPGTKTDSWVLSIDNAPTVLDLVGLKVPEDMQGQSILPILKGKTPKDWRKSMYYHYYEFGSPHWVLPHYGIRTERYKLISYYTINEWELFDLERDPDEMESLLVMEGMAPYPGYEDVVNDLVGQLTDLRKKYNDTTGKPVKFWPRKTYN